MEIVQAVKKINSISRERLNFRRRPVLCTTLYRNPMQESLGTTYKIIARERSMGQGRDRGYASGCQLHSFAFGTDTNMMISLVTFADQLQVIVSKNTFFAVNNPILNIKEVHSKIENG